MYNCLSTRVSATGGSTDALCHSTHGTSDVITAALHVIMGDSRQVDVASVHRDDQLQHVATTMVSYGYFGDLLRTSERWRKLGPTRYLLSGVLQLFRNRFYEGQLNVRKPATPLAQPYDVNICSDRCSVCTKAAVCSPTPGEWLQFKGRWSIVTSAVTSCACRLSPYGVSPAAHLGDGCADLVLVAGRSRYHTLSYLFRTAFTGNALSLDHVTFHRAQEVIFTPKAGAAESSWNCDGELLTEPRLRLRLPLLPLTSQTPNGVGTAIRVVDRDDLRSSDAPLIPHVLPVRATPEVHLHDVPLMHSHWFLQDKIKIKTWQNSRAWNEDTTGLLKSEEKQI
ncbi:Ceramide kinase [Portunus trituberculatus]|uniref:Ceramide kinase n=1 Tax=Portunus trituberculatus TaxID=210409 RepID=A0A5B7DBT3_PORTR|nr:Ceramide kinase [Portunus trituberculatus]